MADFKFEPMRSMLFVDCACEDYRPKLLRWLYKDHIPDSISTFEPYVTKYAFYPTFPIPPEGERFGYVRMQLTEHHWLVNDMDSRLGIKALADIFPKDVLVWQGILPPSAGDGGPLESKVETVNAAYASQQSEIGHPPTYTFLPMWWEKDIKGKGRTIEDGANYRFHMAIGFPEGVDKADGEKWLFDTVIPIIEAAPECTRILASKTKSDINGSQMDWNVECWFENQSGWYKVMVEDMKGLEKPAWAEQDAFPFLKPYHRVSSGAIADYTSVNILQNYHGYICAR